MVGFTYGIYIHCTHDYKEMVRNEILGKIVKNWMFVKGTYMKDLDERSMLWT